MNNEYLQNYAKLIVSLGANVQKGQLVSISAEVYHRELCFLLAQEAYRLGAKYVSIDLSEPRISRERVLHSTQNDLSYVPRYLDPKSRELLDTNAAMIRIIGPEFPEILADLDPKKINTTRKAQYEALKFFYEDGITKSQVHWTIAAAPTPEWAARIFPHLTRAQATDRLWDEIFKICRVDKDNFIDAWSDLNKRLKIRATNLTNLGIKYLHFKGPNTDLRVKLTELALFRGGSEVSSIGVVFQPNIPTEECFTTPDCRGTEGYVRTTRPFLINGKLIQGLNITFKNGEISSFDAEEGKETFKEYLSSDPGAKKLGEVALVGIDSPIFQSNLVFEEILFDENAACHIAIGSAYRFCLKGGTEMGKEQLEEAGCNESSVHTDMMISDENVDVVGELYSGAKVKIITKGSWEKEFL